MQLNGYFQFSNNVLALADKAIEMAQPVFRKIEETAALNQQKVLAAFQKNRVSSIHFAGSNGYGYGDIGRDTLDEVYADIFGAESAVVRHFMISGTHALTVALFGILRPGDTMLSVSGKPYDTLDGIIGIFEKNPGSLRDFGITYREVTLKDEDFDYDAIESALLEHPKMVYVQRSNGYSVRDALRIDKIGRLAAFVKEKSPQSILMVDNCYGEFTEAYEPTEVGADLMAGSLIKNPGGGMADCGGYIAGKEEYVTLCADRLTAPGLGREAGASLGQNLNLYKGIFYAPHTVQEALKTAVFAAAACSLAGFQVRPKYDGLRSDIVQTIGFGTPEGLCAFCRGIQKGSPIDSFVTPEPGEMPGYTSKVIMAAGAFTQGSSIELSADGPLREPYAAYLQGGLIFESAKIGILSALQELCACGLLGETV